MARFTPLSVMFVSLLALAACGGAGPGDSFYLRFDPILEPGGALFVGEGRVCLFKDRIFQTSRGGSAEMLATTQREIDVSHLTPLGDQVFGLRQGVLVKSSDTETFEPVTPMISFGELGGVDTTLVAMRRKSFGVAELFVSKDNGVTWTQLADVDAGFQVGTSESRGISRGLEGKVYLGVGVQDDTFGNSNSAGQTYEFTAATNEVKLISSTKLKLTAPPVPDYRSKDGVSFFTDSNDTIAQQGDASNIKVFINPP